MSRIEELYNKLWADPLKNIIAHEPTLALLHMKQAVGTMPLATFSVRPESTILLFRYPSFTTMRLRYERFNDHTIGTAWLTLGEPTFETMYTGLEVGGSINTMTKLPRPKAFHISQTCQVLKIDGTPHSFDIMCLPKTEDTFFDVLYTSQLFGYGRL